MSTNLYPVLTFESVNTINDKTKRGNVVTTQISKDEWLATYPGFSATAPTETHALERLAQIIERTCVSIRGIANSLRHGHEPLREDQKHKPIRFNIGEFLILTWDCELGKAGDIAEVISIDDRYMTLRFRVYKGEHRTADINTGADYKFIKRLKVCPVCKDGACETKSMECGK